LEQIAYVQFTDVLDPARPRSSERPFPRRTMPGEGDLDLARFADTLRDRGWRGTVSVEIMNRASRDLPVEEFARQAATATRPFWS
jgi:sugar phosphate isomerase/epimerase